MPFMRRNLPTAEERRKNAERRIQMGRKARAKEEEARRKHWSYEGEWYTVFGFKFRIKTRNKEE